MTETHPDLLTARHDLNALVNLLAAGRFSIAEDVAGLANKVRCIVAGHSPETLHASADAVVAADRAMKSADFLTRLLDAYPADAQFLMKDSRAILAAYALDTLAEDEALLDSQLPARAA